MIRIDLKLPIDYTADIIKEKTARYFMRENEELRMIKRLSKEFKGMKERFKNPKPTLFKKNAELFMSNLCIAYDINDVKLNHVAITAYHDVCEVLEKFVFKEDL